MEAKGDWESGTKSDRRATGLLTLFDAYKEQKQDRVAGHFKVIFTVEASFFSYKSDFAAFFVQQGVSKGCINSSTVALNTSTAAMDQACK